MAEPVDSLSIELTASTESAESSIDKLIGKLNRLKGAVAGASNFSRFTKGIAEIAEAAKGLDTEAGRKLARLAGGLDALSKVGNLDNLKGAGKNLSSVVKAVSGMGQTGGKGLSGLADGIKQTNDALGGIKDSDVSRLGAIRDTLAGEVSGPLHTSDRVSESAALGGMGAPEPSFGNMAAYGAMTVFKYTADNIRDATVAYQEFRRAIGGVALEGGRVFTEFADDVRQATGAVKQLKGEINGWTWGNQNSGFDWASAWASRQPKALNAGQNFTGGRTNFDAGQTIETEFVDDRFANYKMAPLEDEFARVSGAAMDMSQSVDEAGATFSHFNSIAWNVGNAASHVAGGFIQMSGIGGFARDILYGVGNDADTASNKMGGLAKVVQDVGGAFSRYGFAAIPQYFGGQLIGNVQNATKSMFGFFNSIKRIAMYRLIRTALRMITQGINEGIKNLYAFSQAAGGTFAASMNQIATASQYLGNSFAAMASPLVEALAPAIDFIVDKFVDMFNTISQIIARLTGKTSYTAAKKVAAQWGGASKSASKSAKDAADEIKRTILGFDEINKLNADNDSSSGGSGGGGGSGGSASSMFEEIPIDSAVASFADSLKAAFLAGDWQELGTLLGGKVNKLVDSIDFAGAGQKVGYYINGWFSTKYWTLDTINFTNIGSKIAEFLNNAIAEIDFGIIGALLVQKMTIFGDLVIGFFTEFDWGQAASKLGDFVKGLYDQLTKWFNKYANSDDMNWGDIGRIIYEKLTDALTNFDLSGVAKSMVTALGTAIRSVVQLGTGFVAGFWADVTAYWDEHIKADDFTVTVHNILDAIGQGFSNLGQWVWDNIIKPFGTALTGNENWDTELLDVGKNIIEGIFKGITNVISDVGTWIRTNIFDPFLKWLKSVFGIASPAKTMEEPGENIVLGIFQGIINALKNVGQWVKDNIFTPIWNAIKDAGETAIEIAVSLVKKVGEWAEDVWNFLQNTGATIAKKVTAAFEAAKSFAGDVWEFIKKGAETIVKTVQAVGEGVATFATTVWQWIREGAETIVKTVQAVGEGVATFATTVWQWIREGAETIVKTVQAVGEGVATFATTVWQWIREGAETIVKTVQAVGEGVATFATTVWQWIREGAETIVKTVQAVGEGVATFATSVWQWIREGAETIVKTVQAVGEGVATFATTVWQWIRNGAETIVKTVEAGMQTAASWVGGIVDFFLGPDSADKTANILMTIGDVAKAIINFLQDPVTVTKNIVLSITTKIGEQLSGFWDWLWGNKQETPSITIPSVAGDVTLTPVPGPGWNTASDPTMWTLDQDVNATAKVNATAGDGFSGSSGNKFSLSGVNDTSAKVNASAGTGFSSVSGNKFTIGGVNDTSTKVNASAGTGFSGLSGNKFTLGGITGGSVTVNGTPGTGFTGKLSGTNKYTLAGIEAANVDVKSKLIGATDGSKTNAEIHGTSYDVKSKLIGNVPSGTDGAKKLSEVYAGYNTFDVKSKLVNNVPAGTDGAKKLSDVYTGYDTFDVKSKLVNNVPAGTDGAKKLSEVYAGYNTFDVKSKLVNNVPAGKDGAKKLSEVYEGNDTFNVKSKLNGAVSSKNGAKKLSDVYKNNNTFSVYSKLTGKSSDSKTLGEVFGTTFTVTATLSTVIKGLGDFAKSVARKVNDELKKLTGNAEGGVIKNGKLSRFASGGIISNGVAQRLSSIPHYAGGTTDAHGTLFLAGEAGPEILGHIGGRTEILNQSQLAQTMFAAVRTAMQGVKIGGTIESAVTSGDGEADYETMYRAMYDAFTDAMAGSDERDREKVQLMRQIAAKEFTAEVTAASVNRAQTRMNRRAGTTIVPVGT